MEIVNWKRGLDEMLSYKLKHNSAVHINAKSTIDYAETRGALALDDIEAEPTPSNWDKFTDGTAIPKAVKRDDPGVARSVMIHIGGYYTTSTGDNKVAGTYGCFGIVDPSQISSTSREALKNARKAVKTIKDKSVALPFKPSNKEQNRLIDAVWKAISLSKERNESDAGETKVTIKKRTKVTKELKR